MRRMRAALIGALTLIATISAAQAATAATTTISPSGTISTGPSTLTITGGGFTIGCVFRFQGQQASTVTSLGAPVNVAVGYLQVAWTGTCTGANGMIPQISSLDDRALTVTLNGWDITVRHTFRRFGFTLSIPIAGSCLYMADVVASTTASSQPITLWSYRFASQSMSRVSGGALCPATVALSGDLALATALTVSIAL